jgi:hypothetical protein
MTYEEFVYVKDGIVHINKAHIGLIYYNNPEIELGITDDYFDKIIEKIQK